MQQQHEMFIMCQLPVDIKFSDKVGHSDRHGWHDDVFMVEGKQLKQKPLNHCQPKHTHTDNTLSPPTTHWNKQCTSISCKQATEL